MMKKLTLLLVLGVMIAACTQQPERIQELPPTATLLPILSQTPRLTATPVPSRTPLPTFTFTPTETVPPPTPSNTPSPTLTPTIVGVVQSLNRVNVREGPGLSFDDFVSLTPGTNIQILGRDAEGEWYNIRMEDGREGWISSRLVFLPPTATPFPTLTPSPNLTALFLGTPLPTAFLGGGTITPTPPGSVMTATPIGAAGTAEVVEGASPTTTPETVANAFIPVIPRPDLDALDATATALVASGVASTTPTRTPTLLPTSDRQIALPSPVSGSPAAESTADVTAEASGTEVTTNEGLTDEQVQALSGVDVFAFCDNLPRYGIGAPRNLAAGSTIDIYWGWFAREEAQVLQHVNNALIELRVNGQLIENINTYRTRIRREGQDYVTYWYVPYGPLNAGTYEITYIVTWETTVTDGYELFGPETNTPFEQESCSFTVR
jgi:hypothetical protein